MKKRIMLPLIILFLISVIGCSSEESKAWQDAYAAALREYPFLNEEDIPLPSDRDGDDIIHEFSLRDLDNNGVPEMLIFKHDYNALNDVFTVYTYDGNIREIGEYSNPKGSFVGGFQISNNPLFPGLFECWWGGGEDHYGYLSIKDGELIYEYLWHNDRTVEPPLQTVFSNNKGLVDESINMYPSDDSADNLLEIQLINNENIDEKLSSNSNNPSESSIFQNPYESSLPNQSSSQNSSNTPLDSPEDATYYSFVVPEVEHIYADKVMRFVKEFSYEFEFPEFESVDTLDLTSYSVSTNLFRLTNSLNRELLSQGGGITPEEKSAYVARGDSIAQVDDMNTVGRRYFGERFLFPKDLICDEIAPLEQGSEFYIWTAARSVILPLQYILTDIQEDSDHIDATFLIYYIQDDWDFERERTLVGIDFFNPNYKVDGAAYFAPFEEPIVPGRVKDDAFYLTQCQLPVPQEELKTITVTFIKGDNGNLIATSCKYNRE